MESNYLKASKTPSWNLLDIDSPPVPASSISENSYSDESSSSYIGPLEVHYTVINIPRLTATLHLHTYNIHLLSS